jgi:large subunit ribosomal protein L32e
MSIKQLMETRRAIKRRKPKFMRQDIQKKKRLKRNWRRPKGSDSKMRVLLKGYRQSVSKGWKSPSEIRGLNRDGLRPKLISNLAELAGVNPKTDILVISSAVGNRKRIIIMEEAIKKGIKIANYKEPQKKVDTIKQVIQKRKDDREKTKTERDQKKEKAKKDADKKKASEKKEADAEKTEEEKKIEDKKEKDKLLISSQ